MKKLEWMIVCALAVAAPIAVSAAGAAPAANAMESAFNGTWHIDAPHTKISPTPVVFYTSGGWYHCTSCQPALDVKADGSDQTVQGQAFDAMSVKDDDPQTLTIMEKKDGKVISERVGTVSKDGKLLTMKITYYPKNGGAPVTTEATAKRVGMAPLGVHATSGKWQIQKFNQSDNGLTFTYQINGDQVTMTDPTGDSYTATLDGGDAPVKGAYGYDTVSLKKIAPDAIEETDKLGGTVVDVSRMTVHGNTMTIVDNGRPGSNMTSTFIAHKQR